MKAELKELTRGRGSLYARLVLCDDAGVPLEGGVYAAVSAHAISPAGDALPCELYCLEGIEGAVLRLPLFQFAQTVTLSREEGAFDAVGTPTGAAAGDALPTPEASARITIDPSKAKWQSRFNTLLKNQTAEAMRNSEARRAGAPEVALTQGYVSQQGQTQYRGYLAYQRTDEKHSRAPLSLTLLDKHAHRLDDSCIIVLGDNVAPNTHTPTLFTRNVTFAIKLPSDDDFAVLCINSEAGGATTFFVLDEEVERRAKDATDAMALSAERDGRYEHWFKDKHSVSAGEVQAQRLVRWESPVSFSMIALGYDEKDALWDGALRSVLAQSYEHFELIIVSEDAGAAPAADIMADSRVQLVNCENTPDVPATSDAAHMNTGIAKAQGEFVCFIRAYDRLEPDFLYCFARGLKECPTAPLLYGDEGKYFEGHYVSPFFKPDWNPDLLTSFNYIGRSFAVRSALLRDLGALTSEHDGAQEYRIALAAGRAAQGETVPYHVRRIISQRVWPAEWRATLYGIEPISSAPALEVLREHCKQHACPARVQPGSAPYTFDVRYDIQGEPLVSIVIATKDSVPILRKCIDSIREKSTYQNFEIIIAENNSTDDATFAYYDEITAADARIKVHSCETGGKVDVSAVNNQGVAAAAGEYVILLNNDIEVIAPDWIERLLGLCQRADVGAVGAKLLYPDGVIQHAGALMHKTSPNFLVFMGPDNIGRGAVLDDCPYYYNLYNVRQDLSICTSACLMTKKSLYEKMGGYDLRFPTDFDDVDYCLRLRAQGLQVVYEPAVKLYHHESVSRGLEMTRERLSSFSYISGLLITLYPEYWAVGDLCLSPYLTNKNRGSNFE